MASSHGQFVWYELTTTDMAGAAAFYTKVMGWGMLDASMPGGPPYALFTSGKKAEALAAFQKADMGNSPAASVAHVWVLYVKRGMAT